MIHTTSKILTVKDENINQLFSMYGHNIQHYNYIQAAVQMLNQDLEKNHSAYKMNWLKYDSKDCWKLNMKVDVVKMLDRSSITEKDYCEVEEHILNFLTDHLGDSTCFEDHTLTRIDYKLDVVVRGEKQREFLFHLFDKYTSFYRFKEKIRWGKDEKGNPIKYETSQYHKNNSTEIIIYSKEDERKAKGETIKAYERDVVRYELRLKNAHLNAMNRKDRGIIRPKKLWCYFNDDLYREYMMKHVSPIVHKGDYYKITLAEKVIANSSFTKDKKNKLRAFLVSISNGNIDTPKGNISMPTYRQYLKDLESLNINPILIPKNRKDFPTYFKNPFRF